MVYKLEKWSTCAARGASVYLPPEANLAIQARSSDRPGFTNGITTSRIVRVEGRVVTTASGTQYELGEPDPVFVEWCLKEGCHDPRNEETPLQLSD